MQPHPLYEEHAETKTVKCWKQSHLVTLPFFELKTVGEAPTVEFCLETKSFGNKVIWLLCPNPEESR